MVVMGIRGEDWGGTGGGISQWLYVHNPHLSMYTRVEKTMKVSLGFQIKMSKSMSI